MKPAERLAALLYPAHRARRPGELRALPPAKERLAKFTRMLQGAPEVFFSIQATGGLGAAAANIAYITRDDDDRVEDKLEVEDERGRAWTAAGARTRVQQWRAVRAVRPDWRGARFAHVVMGMPAGTDPHAVRWAVREFARHTWAGHRYFMALHTDKPHPHVHVCLHRVREDGHVWAPRRPDLAHARERFAQCLVAEGVEAVATSKTVRYATRADVREHLRELGAALATVPDAAVQEVARAASRLAQAQGARPLRRSYAEHKGIGRYAQRSHEAEAG